MLSLRFRCTPPGLRQQLERPGELRTQADCADVFFVPVTSIVIVCVPELNPVIEYSTA